METRFHYRPIAVLKLLFWLRTAAVFGQLLMIAAAQELLGLELPAATLFTVVGLLALFNVAVWRRLRLRRPAGHWEVAFHLTVDIMALTALLHFTGGSTNPFVSLLLVPVAIAAAALPVAHAGTISVICAAAYTYLLIGSPPHSALHGAEGFRLHVQGMWVNFLLSAVIITLFLSALSRIVRRQNELLSEAREQALRNEHVVALGTLAAGAAHAISTPLSTMSVVLSELQQTCDDDPSLRRDLDLLTEQLTAIKSRLGELLRGAGRERSEAGTPLPLEEFLAACLDHWQLLRPEIALDKRMLQPFENPEILAERTLEQALLNLINNAADASLENGSSAVEVEFASADDTLSVRIVDFGRGIPSEYQSKAGREAFTTKGSGLGIGLVLSNATLNLLGGEVTIQPRAAGGSETRVRLPLDRLRTDVDG